MNAAPPMGRPTRNPTGSWVRARPVKIVLDITLLIAFLAAFITREGPDYAIHSWVGIALIPVIIVHLTGNLSWIRQVWKRKREHREFGLGVLNASLGALAGVCIATGFPIWLEWSGTAGLTAVHMITGLASILVMFIHLWRNRKRVKRLIRRSKPAS